MSTTNTVDTHRQRIIEEIEDSRQLYTETSRFIHANPEIGNQEFQASQALTGILEQAGFEVTRNVAGHETGFVARKASARPGPKIGYLAEYDALPGLGHA